jgi:hypothetical protein
MVIAANAGMLSAANFAALELISRESPRQTPPPRRPH